MKLLNKAIYLVVALGLFLAIGGYGEAAIVLSGRTVNLSESVENFDKKALVEGTVDFVYGPFATLEETESTFGITTSRHETDYYIAGNLGEGGPLAVVSVSDAEMKKKFEKAAGEWYDYIMTLLPEYSSLKKRNKPSTAIAVRGKLWNQDKDKDYVKYYGEAQDDLFSVSAELKAAEGFDLSTSNLAKLRVVDGKVDNMMAVVGFFAGVVILLACAVGGIVYLVKQKRASKDEELW